MRVLVTSCPQYGHFFPLVPLAWALRAAGHQVLVAVPENFTGAVESAGLPAIAVGGVVRTRDVMGVGDRTLLDRWSADPHGMHLAAIRTVARFANLLLDPVMQVSRWWLPDLVLHPTLDPTGPVAAALLRIPNVSVGAGPLPTDALAAAAEELHPLYREHGLSAIPPPSLRLNLWPAALLRSPALPARSMRYVSYSGPGTMPDWLREPAVTPRGCVTFGSIVPKTAGVAPLRPILAALGDVLGEVLVILPHEVLPQLSEEGPLPGNVRVVRGGRGPWLPLDLVLRECDLVVHHGGAGTTLTSLTYGLPQLIVPHMADQFAIGESLAEYGAARCLAPTHVSSTSVGEAVTSLVTNPTFGRAALSLRHGIEGEPSPGQTVPLLEELVRSEHHSWSEPSNRADDRSVSSGAGYEVTARRTSPPPASLAPK